MQKKLSTTSKPALLKKKKLSYPSLSTVIARDRRESRGNSIKERESAFSPFACNKKQMFFTVSRLFINSRLAINEQENKERQRRRRHTGNAPRARNLRATSPIWPRWISVYLFFVYVSTLADSPLKYAKFADLRLRTSRNALKIARFRPFRFGTRRNHRNIGEKQK